MQSTVPLSRGQAIRAAVRRCFTTDTTSSLIAFALLFFYFLCSQIMTNSTFVYHVGFYALLLPAFIYAVVKQRSLISELPWNAGMASLVAFGVYVLIHALVFEQANHHFIKSFFDLLYNTLFMLMALAIYHDRRINSTALLRPFIPVVILFSILSLVWYYYTNTDPNIRLTPIGRAHNSIPIDNLYAMGTLFSLWLFFQPSTTRRWKLLCVLCAIMTLITIIISHERGPLLALVVAATVGTAVLRQWRLFGAICLSGLVFGGDFLYYWFEHTSILPLEKLYQTIADFFLSRDTFNVRARIWSYALELIEQRPWTGHGLQSTFKLEGSEGSVNPHNLFLSTAYYLGIPGLVLLLAPLFAAFAYTLRDMASPRNQLCFIFLVHAVLATSTNYGQVVKAPAPLWTIYWLPIAMALANASRRRSP